MQQLVSRTQTHYRDLITTLLNGVLCEVLDLTNNGNINQDTACRLTTLGVSLQAIGKSVDCYSEAINQVQSISLVKPSSRSEMILDIDELDLIE